ncbi:hypothetical protein QFC20_003700 [Naganishia adeliensis]|uniref:Uncharacterized protein n=1 Tax=Naganishia adeliensis TaxID=92952 RepID=A0ACC2W7L2_9TREE|nr:hypothetical protein QFC20_003700 [Naganishia adeliensis]
MVRCLGTYVHLSRKRRKVFMALRRMYDPEETVSLPLKDVATRWNSKYLAIKQAQRLKNTILAFCQRYAADSKCPPLDEEAFSILEIILPTLQLFQTITLVYSKAQVTVHRILPDLNYAIRELERLQALPGVSPARKVPFAAAIAKLKIYFFKFLNNDWVCAAYMLDPESRASSLEAMLKAYNQDQNGRRMKEVTTWVRKCLEVHVTAKTSKKSQPNGNSQVTDKSRAPVRQNEFASRRSHAAIPEDQNVWDLYNAEPSPYGEPSANETILEYWARHRRSARMQPLAMLARNTFGMPGSSVNVERLFSQSGLMLQDRRARLLPMRVIHQASLKIWDREGYRC